MFTESLVIKICQQWSKTTLFGWNATWGQPTLVPTNTHHWGFRSSSTTSPDLLQKGTRIAWSCLPLSKPSAASCSVRHFLASNRFMFWNTSIQFFPIPLLILKTSNILQELRFSWQCAFRISSLGYDII